MEGIYIHIPFCRQACRYCDFFFTVSLHHQDQFTDCLLEEMRITGAEFQPGRLRTLYLGGGTPSLLTSRNLERIMDALHKMFGFHENAEITMECNPDDMDHGFVKRIQRAGFNRISIGVQSFHDSDLQLMKRSHNAGEALKAIQQAAEGGLHNINIDLIYGIPDQSPAQWEINLEKTLTLPVSHLSAYHLTFEEGTILDHWRKKGRVTPVAEETSLTQYRLLRERMGRAGFDHYEISNFAREGYMSRHNLVYWSGDPYLGLGPSAHSYDGLRRWWNVSSLKRYMEGLGKGLEIREKEVLTSRDRYHDYLITTLRTRWGARSDYIREQFGPDVFDHFRSKAGPLMDREILQAAGGRVVLHPEHWMVTDQVLRQLFLD